MGRDDSFLPEGMDSEQVFAVAQAAVEDWKAYQGIARVVAMAEMAREKLKDNKLIYFRAYLQDLHRTDLVKMLETEMGLRPLLEDAQQMRKEALQETQRMYEEGGWRDRS